jgi:hypothetical protein
MPWIRFNERFDYTIKNRRGQPTTVYQPGMEVFVTRARAEAAVSSGKGETIESPRKTRKAANDGAASNRSDAGSRGVR